MPYKPKEKVDLSDGWVVKVFNNPNATKNYHTFISPAGKRFRSRFAVNWFLELLKTTNGDEDEVLAGMVAKKTGVVKAVAVGTKKRKQSGAAVKKGVVVNDIAKKNTNKIVVKKIAVVKDIAKKKQRKQ